MAQLEPYHARLHEIFKRAVARFRSLPDDDLVVFTRFKRGQAVAIWGYLMDEVLREFPLDQLTIKFESIEINFGPNLMGRLKKMSAGGFTSNYPTDRANAYHTEDQGELFVFFWAKPIRIDIGYLLNDTGTDVDRVMVAHRKAPRMIDWVYVIDGPDAGTPQPIKKTPSSPPDEGTQITEKGDGERHRESRAG
jgi:hypothetical protein